MKQVFFLSKIEMTGRNIPLAPINYLRTSRILYDNMITQSSMDTFRRVYTLTLLFYLYLITTWCIFCKKKTLVYFNKLSSSRLRSLIGCSEIPDIILTSGAFNYVHINNNIIT